MKHLATLLARTPTFAMARRLRRICVMALALALPLAGCMGPSDGLSYEDGQRAKIQAYAAAKGQSVDPDRGTPVVSARGTIARYASIFRDGCLRTMPSFAGASEAFIAAGLRPVPQQRYQLRTNGYLPPDSQFIQGMSPPYREYALANPNAKGQVLWIIDVIDTQGKTATQTFTDGVVVAEITMGRSVNDICSVRLKTRDDDPLMAELQRVVNETGLASGPPRDTGLFGAGYTLDKKTFVTLGRQRRSSQSPTRLSAMVLNKR